MVLISLLNLPLELPKEAPARESGVDSFMGGVGKWISKCKLAKRSCCWLGAFD